MFNKNSFWAIFLAGLTPIPFTVFTISAGVFKTNIIIFLVASLFGRGFRYIFVGIISYFLGKRFASLFLRYFDLVAILLIIAVVIYFILKI
jgi:membrane protein YqaA with SNARE-associated domain